MFPLVYVRGKLSGDVEGKRNVLKGLDKRSVMVCDESFVQRRLVK